VLVLDIILIGGVISIYFGHVFAGELKTAFNYIFIGIIIFSIDHLVETIMLALGVGLDASEITHRVIHLAGFAFLLYGFYRVRKVITSLEAKGQKK
jgi:threonine/homoserine/homoserine lactone efflux protein